MSCVMKSLLCLVMLVAFSWTSYAQPQSNENENKKIVHVLRDCRNVKVYE